jgi:hypothetical protein
MLMEAQNSVIVKSTEQSVCEPPHRLAIWDGNHYLRVEITAARLLHLLAGGQVCAADFRCLDCESEQCLRRLCIQSCAMPLRKQACHAQAQGPVDRL